MKSLIIIILCFLGYLTAYGQLNEGFSDGELFENPTWLGDVSDFEVVDGILHLNAEDGGVSNIYTELDFPDSILWTLNMQMIFAPSGSNQLTIVLASKEAENLDNAYYLKVGETGSTDALLFYRSVDGVETLLGQATEGTLGIDPAIANVIVKYDNQNLWTISGDYDTGILEEEMVIFDDSFKPSEYNYFAVNCKYTSSRKDKFYFDFFFIDIIKPDITPPSVTKAIVNNKHQVKLLFSEAVTSATANDKLNYTFLPSLNVDAILWKQENPKELFLIINEGLASGVTYELSINNISDEIGNIMPLSVVEVSLLENIEHGDLVINEILFNPVAGGEDFIEVYNKSKKTLRIDSLILFNALNSQIIPIRTSKTLMPNSYLAFTSDKASLLSLFPKNDSEQILEQKTPSMNNAYGNISLYTYYKNNVVMIDSFNYHESLHFPFLDDIEGVSLERIDPNKETNNIKNWHSAAGQFSFGTPGIKNSISIPDLSEIEGMFKVVTEVFSPDSDGFDDLLLVQYELDDIESLYDATIYNSNGVHIIDLLTNTTLGTEGFFTWDGIDKNGDLSPIGIYIIHISSLSVKQERNFYKKTCVLARHL